MAAINEYPKRLNSPYLDTLKRKLAYAKEFHPAKVGYYEEQIKQWQDNTPDTNRYTLKWNGKVQPLGDNSFHSVKMYIQSSLRIGGCYLWQFEIFTQWGQLKTNIINDKNANPMLSENYFKIY